MLSYPEHLYTFQYYDHTPKVIYDLTSDQYGYLTEQIKARQERLFTFKRAPPPPLPRAKSICPEPKHEKVLCINQTTGM